MAKEHYLRFLIKDQPEKEDLIFMVRKEDSDRLATVLNDLDAENAAAPFFWFDALDGRSVVINLFEVQGVRLLWEVSRAPPDLVRHRGAIQIRLKGRRAVLSENTEEPEQIFDLFTTLEHRPPPSVYTSFIDVDGEPFYLNTREIVYIVAPKHLLDEGRKIAHGEEESD